MAPRTQREEHEDELRSRVDAAHLVYERARLAGLDADVALSAWKVALEAFVAAVLPPDD